jgi:hypothetical protein
LISSILQIAGSDGVSPQKLAQQGRGQAALGRIEKVTVIPPPEKELQATGKGKGRKAGGQQGRKQGPKQRRVVPASQAGRAGTRAALRALCEEQEDEEQDDDLNDY